MISEHRSLYPQSGQIQLQQTVSDGTTQKMGARMSVRDPLNGPFNESTLTGEEGHCQSI